MTTDDKAPPWEALLDVPAFRYSPRYRALQQARSAAGRHYRQVLAQMQQRVSVAAQETIHMPIYRLPMCYTETGELDRYTEQVQAVREVARPEIVQESH